MNVPSGKLVQLQINADLGKAGSVGDRAEKVAQALLERGMLHSVLARSRRFSELPSERVKTCFPGYRTLSLGINYLAKVHGMPVNSYRLRNRMFDRGFKASVAECDTFHTWDRTPECLKRAREVGAVTALDVAMDLWAGDDLQYVDYIFVPSRKLCDKAVALGFAEDRVCYQPFGVDTDFFTPARDAPDKVRFLFSGILNDRKGIGQLLQAWKSANLRGAELVLCGRETPFFRAAMRKISPENVVVRGFLSHARLLDEYQAARAFVFPSRKEGSAKALYEALACGLPVITTVESGSVITDGVEGFLVGQQDVQALAEKLALLAENADLAARMGRAARQTAEQFTWRRYQERALAYYQRMLA